MQQTLASRKERKVSDNVKRNEKSESESESERERERDRDRQRQTERERGGSEQKQSPVKQPRHRRPPVVSKLTANHLKQHRPRTPQVSLTVVPLVLEDLGCHVEGGTAEGFGEGGCGEVTGEAEVGDF